MTLFDRHLESLSPIVQATKSHDAILSGGRSGSAITKFFSPACRPVTQLCRRRSPSRVLLRFCVHCQLANCAAECGPARRKAAWPSKRRIVRILVQGFLRTGRRKKCPRYRHSKPSRAGHERYPRTGLCRPSAPGRNGNRHPSTTWCGYSCSQYSNRS